MANARVVGRTATRPAPVPGFDDYLSFQIISLGNKLTQTTERLARQHALSVNQWRVMSIVANLNDVCAADIVATAGIDKTTVSRAISELHGRGLLSFHPNPADRRQTLLRLTPAGRELYSDMQVTDLELDESFKGELSARELNSILRMIERLQQKADEML